MLRVDRSSPDDARFVIESLIPDQESRLLWMRLLAEAMQAAHTVHAASWAVTLFDDGLRLNVGRIETVVFGQSWAMLVLDAGRFSDDDLHDIRAHPQLGRVDAYTSVRGTVNVSLPYDLEPAEFLDAREALLPLIERAAGMVRTRTTYARTHSTGVVSYVAQATGRDLPQPDHRW